MSAFALLPSPETATANYRCCVARDGARMARGRYPIWTGAIYKAVARKSDGVVTWRRAGNFGGTRSGYGPSAKFQAEIREAAEYRFQPVSHGQRIA